VCWFVASLLKDRFELVVAQPQPKIVENLTDGKLQ
jgi:hypothetical protein